MQKDWGDETPDLASLFDFPGVFPTQVVESPGVWGEELCVDNLIHPERYTIHDYVDYDYDNGKRATPKCRAQVHLNGVEERLVSRSFFALRAIVLIPLKEAAEETCLLLILTIVVVHTLHIPSLLLSSLTSLLFSSSALFRQLSQVVVCHYDF